MPSLWFCVPVHGRLRLTAICLRQLRRTCDALTDSGIEATVVVIGDDANLEVADELGFAIVERDNRFVSRKFNDGIQFALDRRFNPRPADYVVPCGSDDWVDYHILLDLPEPNTVLGFQHISFVREDGREMTSHFIDYAGGCGIRVYSRHVMARVGYRPADEDRGRACDTSILTNVGRANRHLTIKHVSIDPRSIVDWKSPAENLNPYDSITRRYRSHGSSDPFEELAGIYPDESLAEMERHYAKELVAA